MSSGQGWRGFFTNLCVPMKETKKLKLFESQNLTSTVIFLVFVLLLISTGLFLVFNYKKLKEDVINWDMELMHTLVLAYSEMVNGDSVEVALQRKQTDAYYDRLSVVSDSLLKKMGVKYLYVMNAAYGDSIEFYVGAKSHKGKPDFLEKVAIEAFDVDIINKLKDKSETHVCGKR